MGAVQIIVSPVNHSATSPSRPARVGLPSSVSAPAVRHAASYLNTTPRCRRRRSTPGRGRPPARAASTRADPGASAGVRRPLGGPAADPGRSRNGTGADGATVTGVRGSREPTTAGTRRTVGGTRVRRHPDDPGPSRPRRDDPGTATRPVAAGGVADRSADRYRSSLTVTPSRSTPSGRSSSSTSTNQT